MTEQPWGVDANNPLDEGSEPTAVPGGSIGEQRAGDDPTARDGTDVRPPGKPLAYDPDEEHQPLAGEQGGQPNFGVLGAVAIVPGLASAVAAKPISRLMSGVR
jgi:hypothetical protein